MKVALVGTSNSLLKFGLQAALRFRFGDDNVSNYSLGASFNALSTFTVDFESIKEADVILLDYSVNEQVFYSDGLLSLDTIELVLNSFLSYLHPSRALPIILNFATKQKKGTRVVADFYKAFAEKRGLPFFDMFDWIENVDAHCKIDRNSYFLDSVHLTNLVATLAGLDLAEEIERLACDSPLYREEYYSGPSAHFIPLSNVAPQTISRTNSLRSSTLATVSIGESLEVNCRDGVLIGSVFNMRETSSELIFESQQQLRSQSPHTAVYQGVGDGFVMAVRPIVPMKILGKVLVRCGSMPSGERFTKATPLIEIEGIVVLNEAERRLQISRESDGINICKRIPETRYATNALTLSRALRENGPKVLTI